MTRPQRATGAMINAFTPGSGHLSPEDEALAERRARLLGPAYRLFYETPVHLVRGQGVHLYDTAGRRLALWELLLKKRWRENASIIATFEPWKP